MDEAVKIILDPMLLTQESKRRFPYDDKTGKAVEPGNRLYGKISIGIGRNLTDVGLHENEIQLCYANDVKDAEQAAVSVIGSAFYALSPKRRAVLIDMAFNMGRNGLASFVNTLQYIRDGNFAQAAANMRLSKWAKQVGQRAEQLAVMMESG